jgi:hypothetical protein
MLKKQIANDIEIFVERIKFWMSNIYSKLFENGR